MLAFNQQFSARQVCGPDAQVLTSILEQDVNLAAWQRTLPSAIDSFVSALLATGTPVCRSVSLDLAASPKPDMKDVIPASSSLPGYLEFTADLALLVDMFVCLFEARRVGLRVRSLDRAMCPRWHVDQVPVRLITTYSGPGSHWLGEDLMPRNALGSPRSDDWAHVPASGMLGAGDVAMFKGERWQGNEGRGIIHRSPSPAAGERRLVVTLDWLS